MKSRILIILLLSAPLFCYGQENINHSLEISITIEPYLEDGSLPRGITLNYAQFLKPYFTWGLSGRIMNLDYTSIWATGTYLQQIGDFFTIPLEIGTGFKVKNLDITDVDNDGIGLFLHFKSGLNWHFSNNWSYNFHATYNYDILTDDNKTFLNLGMSYLF